MLLCCKENGNKGVIEKEQTKTVSKSYKAEDGSRAKVTFETKDGRETISILSNGKTIALDKKADGEYQRNDITAKFIGDSLKIDQGNNVISLGLDK